MWWKLTIFFVFSLCLAASLARAATPESGDPPGAEEPAEEPAEETGSADAERSVDERLDALLSEVSTENYGESRRCLSRYQYRRVKVLNIEYVLFSKGDVYWLNRLKRPCQPLKFNDLPVFESRGTNSVCQGDPFYPSNSMDMQQGLDHTGRPRGTYGVCYLGEYQLISAEQAALLMSP